MLRVFGLSLSCVWFAFGAPDTLDFNRDIRPILSENCLHCHGPDAAERKAKLRLDTAEGAAEVIRSGELLARIRSTDPDEMMPPPDANRVVSKVDRKRLADWVADGAPYAEHWAFVKPSRDASKTIDDFVDARRGRPASPPAERHTLIRRLSLDLTGLPPRPEQVAAFVNDPSPYANERLVDRLLASQHFGERWARPWLDLARYADSNGFQADQLRDSWAFRDWVIQAMNENMRFDQFTTEQLAGDLLPGSTMRQKIATGFHRTVTCNVEAGVHVEENRMNQVFDRVNTTATVWLGLTLECSQCHDHKYDPLPQADYYKMLAYFNNTPVEVRNPSGKGVSFDFYGPKMNLPLDGAKAAQKEALMAERVALHAEHKARRDSAKVFAEWLAANEKRVRNLDWRPGWETLELVGWKSNGEDTHKVLKDGSILLGGPVPNNVVHTLRFRTDLRGIRSFRVDALTHESLPGKGPGRGDPKRTNFILSEFGVKADGKAVSLNRPRADFEQRGWEVRKALDGDRKTGWAIAPQFGKPHWATFYAKTPVGPDGVKELVITLDQNYGTGRVLGRVKISAATSENVDEELPAEITAILQKSKKARSNAEQKKLREAFRQGDRQLEDITVRIVELDKQIKAIQPDSTLVMIEKEEPRETFVLARGNYLSPQEQVSAGTPEILHGLDAELPANRLGLAQWLMDAENPLVARVTVNRWWAELFGRGLVETLEDFGTQAAPPSHPELLDWLAVEFVESGWDRKHMIKTMVLSEAYQQRSAVNTELLEADPDNRWLTRGPRFRLDAETIRDNALAASGLLSPLMYGKPVMPYQPDKVWRQVGRNEPKWVEQTDQNRWRRGIYIVYRRAAPYPSMVNFDAPDRGACTVQRGRTNTPMQALTLMNDPAYVEIAMALAERVLRDRSEFGERLDYAFQCVLARSPNERESAFLSRVYEVQKAAFGADEKAAESLVAGTRGVLRPEAEPAELAAWFHITSTLFNLDESMTKE